MPANVASPSIPPSSPPDTTASSVQSEACISRSLPVQFLPAMDRLSALPLELLDMIYQFVQLHGVLHVASLRSCNHRHANAGSHYLFPVLVIGPRKRLLRRLKWVAARPHFARGVTAIEYDVTRYWCDGSRPRDKRDSETPVLHNWLNIYEDQRRILNSGELLETLISMLPYYPNVRAATISNRDIGRGPGRSMASLMSPIPHYHAYSCLVRAFAQSSYRLREFSVFPQNLKDGEILAGMRHFTFPELAQPTQATFKHLTALCLKSPLHCIYGVQNINIDEILEIGLIAQVLGYATGLQRLSLTFHSEPYLRRRVPLVSVIGKHTWSSLEQIELDGIDISHATELCEFLIRHRNTIITITLRNTNLMEGQWIAVADCFRDLPELRGLLLEGLAVESCEYLDRVTIMEMNERAMGGRPNSLIPDMDPLLGALNSS